MVGAGAATGELLSVAVDAERHGRLGEAYRAFELAYKAAAAAGDDVSAARALLGYGSMWANERRGTEEYIPYQARLRDLRARLADDQPLLAARISLRLAVDACFAERGPRADVRDAIDRVRGFGDPYALWEALSLYHHLLMSPHDADEREAIRKEMVAAAADSGVPWCTATALMWSAVDAVLRGDPDAVHDIEQHRQHAHAHDVANFEYHAALLDVCLALRAGRLEGLEPEIDRLCAVGTELGETDAVVLYSGQLLALRWLQGRVLELLPFTVDISNSPALHRSNRVYTAIAAALLALAGEHDEARVALARVGAFDGEPFGLLPSGMWLLTMFGVVEAAHELADVEQAARCYRALEPFSELPIIASVALVCLGSVHRSLARCAHTLGDTHLAIKHYERAIDDDLRFGNLSVLALTRAELASELVARNEGDDRFRARDHLGRAIGAGIGFAMHPRVAAWKAELAQLDELLRRDQSGRCSAVPEGWEIARGSERAVIPDGVGINLLATLLANPNVPIPADRLVGAVEDHANDPLLDSTARRALLHRVEQLRAVASAADDAGDTAAAAQARDELDRIASELAHSVRPDGASRTFAGTQERARTSVQKAIRRALRQIAAQAPRIADELGATVHTGMCCHYAPAAAGSPWRVDRELRAAR